MVSIRTLSFRGGDECDEGVTTCQVHWRRQKQRSVAEIDGVAKQQYLRVVRFQAERQRTAPEIEPMPPPVLPTPRPTWNNWMSEAVIDSTTFFESIVNKPASKTICTARCFFFFSLGWISNKMHSLFFTSSEHFSFKIVYTRVRSVSNMVEVDADWWKRKFFQFEKRTVKKPIQNILSLSKRKLTADRFWTRLSSIFKIAAWRQSVCFNDDKEDGNENEDDEDDDNNGSSAGHAFRNCAR